MQKMGVGLIMLVRPNTFQVKLEQVISYVCAIRDKTHPLVEEFALKQYQQVNIYFM